MVWVLSTALVAGIARRIVAGLLVSALSAWLLKGRARSRVFVFALGALCTLWGAEMARRMEARDVGTEALMAGATQWTATVVGFPRTSKYGVSFDARGAVHGRDVTVRVRTKRFDIHYGERLALEGKWRARNDRWPGSFTAKRITRLGIEGHPVRRWLWRLHDGARRRLMRSTGANAALPLALVLGEKGHLPRKRREDFVRLGISHLFALSGMHLGLLALVLAKGTQLLPWGRRAALAAALTLYVGVVGDIDSLNRALVMALTLITARVLQRPVQPLHALGLALFFLLLVDPSSLGSAGFQLSFSATFAVLLLAPHIGPPAVVWKQASWPVRFLLGARATILMGIGVTVFVAPIQLSHFGEVSLVGPLATWVFATAVAFMLIASLAAIPAADVPYVGDGLWYVSGWLDQALWWAARVAPDPVELPAPDALAFYAGLALLWKGSRAGRVVGALLVAASFFASFSGGRT